MGVGTALNAALNASARAVFLDRDGVLNRAIVRDGKPYPPASLDELEIVENAAGSLRLLKDLGFLLLVVTNQPDVARGTSSRALVDAIHERLRDLLPLDAILACFHDDADECECRKPRPGLLLRAAGDLRIDLSLSFMIGDRWYDVEAGKRAGCRTVLVGRGYDEQATITCDFCVGSLMEAAAIIIRESDSR